MSMTVFKPSATQRMGLNNHPLNSRIYPSTIPASSSAFRSHVR